MADQQPSKPTLTETANDEFSLDLTATPTSAGALVTTDAAATPVASADAGGLSYASAHADERARMDEIIKSISLTDSESIINLGTEERKKLADLSDQILDSINPSVKMAFVEALKQLIDAVKANSIDEMKQRLQGGAFAQFGKALGGLFGGNSEEAQLKRSKKMIENFMTDISSSRKTIQEMIDKLQDQQVELNKNYGRINALGAGMVETAQDMRVVRAATAEYIRRVEAGEITTLTDLEATAKASQRADDTQALQEAQANWNNLRTVDGSLLGSIGVFEMNVANLAFTKQANLQNRLQTATTLTQSVEQWKSQLATFAIVTGEVAAAKMLDAADQLTAQSIKKNQELFDTLVDITVGRSAQGAFNLRQIIETQGQMAAKLAGVGEQVEKNFEALAADKKALEESSRKFRAEMIDVYSKKGGVLSTPTPKAPGR